MRLADFIEASIEPILVDWVAFARTCAPAKTMDLTALRDHAAEMLANMVTDLRTVQSSVEQIEKSKGNAAVIDGPDTAAEVHGAGRAESGFSLEEMVSEYRALRASVIRLWTIAEGHLTGADLDDLMRFNEAIDQALAESITRYTEDLDHSKEMFIAILGHDLRNPLGAITLSSQTMIESGELRGANMMLATGIERSSIRMNGMVEDLLDFTRSRLGSGVPITRGATDIGRVARDAVDEVRAAHPASILTLETSGDLNGNWDAQRMTQVIVNLLANAAQHGDADKPVSVTIHGEPDQVLLRVHNHGLVIPASAIHGLFSPLKRLRPNERPTHDSGHLGLGLYIAERIVTAHAGTIEVTSSEEEGTSFTVRLPR